MLDLRRDLFIHLAISAQKDKSLNTPFRVVHGEMLDKRLKSLKKTSANKVDEFVSTALEKKVLDNLVVHDIGDTFVVQSSGAKSKTKISKNISTIAPKNAKSSVSEKIDEKVDKIIGNPQLTEIKMDLEIAEELLKKIKSVDMHNAKIPLLEQTIIRLKLALEQKIYV
jgi:hypothetical protein